MAGGKHLRVHTSTWLGARPYWQAIPQILACRTVAGLALAVVLAGLRALASWALTSQGRVAVTSGDWHFLLTSWQGWLLALAGLATLFAYVALNLNVMVALAGHIVRGEDAPLRQVVREGASAIRRLLCPEGIGVVLYIALLAPIVGVGVGISLTENLRIPSFISSVIDATPLYSVAYSAVVLVFGVIGFFGLYTIHGVVLEGQGVGEARAASRQLMRANWRDYLKRTLLFGLKTFGATALVALVAIGIPFAAVFALGRAPETLRFWTLLVCLVGATLGSVATMLAAPFTLIKMTELYEGYRTGGRVQLQTRAPRTSKLGVVLGTLALAGCVGIAYVCNAFFDQLFPAQVSVGIVAHRGGGNEGPENTVAGLRTAAGLGAWASEIDIQRTLDGAYVVNHDTNFARTTGNAHKPGELTLAEVRELSVGGEPVATYEEMLDAARETGLILLVELKGASADRQMAEDAVRIASEHDMLEGCVFISLDYSLIDYLETAHPEAQTGFLTWASYGDTAALNCDYLGLEELSATFDAVEAAHAQGKHVLVWTPNDEEAQRHFLAGTADAIITDNVAQAREVTAQLEARSDIERVIDALLSLV